MRTISTLLLMMATLALACQANAQSLRGSRASIAKQNQAAVSYGYSFLQSSSSINSFVEKGILQQVYPSSQLQLHGVSFPYARPEVKLFLNRLSAQYRAACGEKLIVTSLSRPIDRQPANAARNSVHPTGMAVDLRIPSKSSCRSWLEQTLLSLEGANLLDVTRERRPPHYHVAVFTKSYQNYVASRTQPQQEYLVRPGDSLWRIATRTGASVAQLRSANGLTSDLINVGQRLQVPVLNSGAAEEVAAVSEVSHRVRRGETLWRLSNRYGTSVDNIRALNGLRGNLLQVGQVLKINEGVTNY